MLPPVGLYTHFAVVNVFVVGSSLALGELETVEKSDKFALDSAFTLLWEVSGDIGKIVGFVLQTIKT